MLTLVTAWYILKAKYNIQQYENWIRNFLLNVKEFKLIIYTNEESKYLIESFIQDNSNIKMIILEIDNFYGYKFKDHWIKNHIQNTLLNNEINWEVNMLWAEKISFVKRSIDNNYFGSDKSEWYGWCDIGYFRGGGDNMDVNKMKEWPNKDKIQLLNRNKIYYTEVQKDENVINTLVRIILNKNEIGLPIEPIPADQTSIAGGFFLITPDNINWWNQVFYNRLYEYFENNYLVKDDQMIIIDCIINNLSKFNLIKEMMPGMDHWFAFTHYLL